MHPAEVKCLVAYVPDSTSQWFPKKWNNHHPPLGQSGSAKPHRATKLEIGIP